MGKFGRSAVPQNVPALAGLNEITFVGSSPYGVVIFTQKKFKLHQNIVRKCKDLAGKRLNKQECPQHFTLIMNGEC